MSISSVIQNLLLGAVFAILILLLFLKSFRATLVIGLSIPIAVISTFTLMYFTGETVNILTMGGLALGIGMMVDSAIVILEHIVTYRERGYSMKEAARLGATEIAPAVIASTTTTLVVFLPIIFVEGIASEIFAPLALTVAFALIASLIASITLIPMLSSKLLTKAMQDSGRRYWFDRFLDKVVAIYQKMLRGVLRFRKTSILGTLAIIVATLFLFRSSGKQHLSQKRTKDKLKFLLKHQQERHSVQHEKSLIRSMKSLPKIPISWNPTTCPSVPEVKAARWVVAPIQEAI